MSETYDPTAADGRRTSSELVTKKDLRTAAIVIVVLFALLTPAYFVMRGNAYRSTCSKNLNKIWGAIGLYSTDHDDRYPFAYETDGFNSEELGRKKNGLPYSWQWEIKPYLSDTSVFVCPAASDAENNKTSDGDKILVSSYGMLWAYSGVDSHSIADPASKVLLGDTSTSKANGTMDSYPLLDSHGVRVASDGFLIGFNDNNLYPDTNPAKSKYVTRLAFPNSAATGLNGDTATRHPNSSQYLSADGHLLHLKGGDANIIRFGGSLGMWDVPKRDSRR